MDDRTLYTMYHNTDTKTEAWEIAIAQAEDMIGRITAQHNLHGADREDVMQDCRIAVLQALDTYDYAKCAWRTWVRQYIRGVVYQGAYKARYGGNSAYKYNKYDVQYNTSIYRDVNTDEDCDGYITPLAYDGDSVEDIVLSNLQRAKDRDKLLCAIAKLTPRQRQIVTMTYGLDGKNPMDDTQISNVLQIKIDTVKDARYIAMRRLRALYGARYQQNYDKTGARLRDIKGRRVVVVRYGGCKDVDAVMYDGNSYYYIYGTPLIKIQDRDIMRSNCTAKYRQIDADTLIAGQCASAYF